MKKSNPNAIRWRQHGVRVIPADSLDCNTAQTPGMSRAAAINFALSDPLRYSCATSIP